jgi:putative oxidoreductase
MDFISHPDQVNQWGILILRLGVGVVFLLHGYSKMKFWKMQPSEQLSSGMISILRLLSIVEPLGGLAVIIGFLTQWASLGFGIIMVGAIRLKALKMHKTFTDQNGWGYDYILLAVAIALMLIGPGSLSVGKIL